jgi:hypothetical protein
MKTGSTPQRNSKKLEKLQKEVLGACLVAAHFQQRHKL